MEIMKVLNCLKSISLIFGGSILLIGCSWTSDPPEELPNNEIKYDHTFEIIYGKENKVDTVIAYKATFDHYTRSAWFMDSTERITSVYYEVERVKEIDNK